MTYSEIVDYLKGDENKGAGLLIQIAKEQEKILLKIKEKEKELLEARSDYKLTTASIENVCKHLKIQPHFHITKDRKYYHFTPEFKVRVSDINWEL